MSKSDKGDKNTSSGKKGTLIAGVLLGMILGLIAAGGVAWYIVKKNPSSFENKESREAPKVVAPQIKTEPVPTPAPVPAAAPASASAPVAASAVGATKQHFEFYKVLTDKPDGTTHKNNGKSSPTAQQSKPAQAVESAKEIYYVQAGSFPKEEDAEKLKASLAILGLEASLQTAVIPDRGTYHRVRLGPFNSNNETNKILSMLKQNGVNNATAIKVQ
jgi:cell division protein FtsN